jgi:peptidoglycan/xylan/chitin deacetylase (PgdA/CDA1 family)
LITFDDGLMNNAEMAEPILKAHSLSAVCFVCPELSERGEKIWADRAWEGVTFGTLSRIDLTPLGGPSISLPAEPHRRALLAQSIIEQMKLLLDSERLQWMSTLQSQGALDSRATEPSVFTLMTLSDIRTMAARGTIAIGSHTMTHPILSRLLIERQKHEIGECKKTLARAGVSSVPLFAYPNGKPIDFTEDTVSILKQEGYCAAFTTTEEMFSASADTWRVPRLLIGHDTNIWEFKAKLSGLEGAIRRLFSVAKQ